jgi:hypothetical protein
VAAVDNRVNVGPFAEGSFGPPRPPARCTLVKVKKKTKHKTTTVRKCVTSTHKAAKKKKHH